MLRPASESGEQENQEDDGRGGGQRPARERGVSQRGTRQKKRDGGEKKRPLHTGRISGYTAAMARSAGGVLVGVLAVVGLLLAATALIVALAVGLPALGLNAYARNPLDFTLRGLSTAAAFYVIGAALLVASTRWIRNRVGPQDARKVLPVGGLIAGVFVVLSIWMDALGYWTNIPILLFFIGGILAPIALGFWLPSGSHAARVRS